MHCNAIGARSLVGWLAAWLLLFENWKENYFKVQRACDEELFDTRSCLYFVSRSRSVVVFCIKWAFVSCGWWCQVLSVRASLIRLEFCSCNLNFERNWTSCNKIELNWIMCQTNPSNLPHFMPQKRQQWSKSRLKTQQHWLHNNWWDQKSREPHHVVLLWFPLGNYSDPIHNNLKRSRKGSPW